jgi:hypothetical protein
MIATNFAKYIRLKTKTNTTTFTDPDIILLANIIKDDICKEVSRADEDYFGMETVRDLIADQRNYKFPSYVLSKIKLTQAKVDGTNWRELNEFDVNERSKNSLPEMTTDEASIIKNWAGKRPSFDIFGGELIIYSDTPIIDVVGGLKLWSIIYPADLTALDGINDLSIAPSNITFGVPRQLHKVWAKMVVIEWKNAQPRQVPLNENEQNIQTELAMAINSLKDQNLDRSTTPANVYNDGSQY